MATKTFLKKGGSGSGGSKIRFVMLDAELRDGDITEITHAITSALRQAQPGQRLIPAAAPDAPEAGQNGKEAVGQQEREDEVEEIVETEDVAPRSAKPRKSSNPRVLSEVDLNSGEMPFATFAEQKGLPKQALKRYLLVAYWFKKYRNTPSVSQDHVFTCYKKMGWGTGTADFAQPLRDLSRFGRGDFTPPNFTINHIGEDLVEKMTK